MAVTPRVLFLAVRMGPGFGVSVVVHEVARRLIARGIPAMVGCVRAEGTFADVPVRRVRPDAAAVQRIARRFGATHVVAHTSPYFELLPELQGLQTWVWEHGDPDPAFFPAPADRAAREAQKAHKRSAVYPAVDGIIAISRFIRAEIGRPDAHVIPNGWEHVLADQATAPDAPVSRTGTSTLKLGGLMRLGPGEGLYKGAEAYVALARRMRESGLDAELGLLGRGRARDARPFEAEGIRVIRNASDAERARFLAGLDVFVSMSLWEGCNLPLLEAQALGTPALALDTGAHPETCAHLCASPADMLRLVRIWQRDRARLAEAGALARRFVRGGLGWESTAGRFRALLTRST
ncbi:glycosyltransferase family 4 protein [Algiphilus sp.]|uniref:glycosyltransferase family 4 protein n=1 Tax=Algiphilus sp. TaxID=1872431 RepID=UPI0025BDF712|nr:glycosyltransferase family 4 protein [Algiphilus sp.]MCK5768897.1 glycosyltransferase family 4 protein [Algiphilus sp.]